MGKLPRGERFHMTVQTRPFARLQWALPAFALALGLATIPAPAAPLVQRPVAPTASGNLVPISDEIDEPDEYEEPEYEEPEYYEPEYEEPEYEEPEYEGSEYEETDSHEEGSYEETYEEGSESEIEESLEGTSSGEGYEESHDEDGHDEESGEDEHEDEGEQESEQESSGDHHDGDDDGASGWAGEEGADFAEGMIEEFDEHGFATVSAEFLVLVDATRNELSNLGAARVEETYRLEGLQMSLYRVQVSSEGDIAEIALELSDYGEDAAADYNHLYEVESGEGPAVSDGCAPLDCARLMMWPGAAGAGLQIGLIDTALDLTHPTLVGADIETASFTRPGLETPLDHGTAVASILVGRDDGTPLGLVPGAKLYAASVFTGNGDGRRSATTESLIRALDWCLGEGATTINMSLAGPPNRLLEFAIARARDLDRHVVAAVGNAGPAAPPLYPAAYNEVTAVTAVDGAANVYRRANRGAHVDFSAPGVNVVAATPGGGYAAVSGTSFAAPFVTALLATRQAEAPGGTDLEEELRRNALDLGDTGFDPIYGFGLMQWHDEGPAYVQ